jgi:RHS repeat-associated protein
VNPFLYTARESDSDIGLYSYRARYFHQAVGRFVNEDPIRFNGQDVNLFRFVRNRPTKYVNPRGLLVIDPDFDGNCLPDLQKALEIVTRVAKRDPRCNCLFRNTGSGRSLEDLVQDPDITIRYSSRDEYQRDRSGRIIGATFGHTPLYETRRFYIRPIACVTGDGLSQALSSTNSFTLLPGLLPATKTRRRG